MNEGKTMLATIGRICGWNILVQFCLSLGLWVYMGAQPGGEEGLGFAILMLFLIGAHVSVAVLVSIILAVMGKGDQAIGFLLAALAVGLAGMSFCFGGAAMYDLN